MRLPVSCADVRRTLRRFVRDTRAAVGIAAALLTVGTAAATALIVDHIWLYDQRDVLKTAAEASSIAATLEFNENPTVSEAELGAIARRYVVVNLGHLSSGRLQEAKDSLKIALDVNRAQRSVKVTATADLGGTLFSRHLPLLGSYKGPQTIQVEAGVESDSQPAEVVLAIDTSHSMEASLEGFGTPTSSSNPPRIDIVKQAALNLVDILKPDADNQVAVGIVPWHIQVRLDSTTADHWVRGGRGWAARPKKRRYEVPYLNCDRRNANACTNLPAAIEETLPGPDHKAWERCLDEHRMGSDSTAAQPGTIAERLAPPSKDNHFAQGFFTPGFGIALECLDPGSPGFPAGVQYQRCYRLASGVIPSKDEAAVLRQSKIYPALNPDNSPQSPQNDCVYGTAAILPLSTDPDEIKQRIRTLKGVGDLTYSALGVLWGQRVLSHSWKSAWRSTGAHPMDPGASQDEVRKAIVLLTDGEDTYCGRGKHGCDDSPVGLSRTEACAEVKSRGTEIYVVAAIKPENISNRFGKALEECSSQNDKEYPAGTRRPNGKYVFVSNATTEDLGAAFADIASQLRSLRRTH